MGWDTEVIIIAEKIKSVESGKRIGRLIFEKDSKNYERELFCIIEEEKEISTFYAYERRKYLPYWVIEKISMETKDVKFTMLGSCPDFIGGPAGLMRIENGKIIDSYGIGRLKIKSIRKEIISHPKKFKKLIFDWFRIGGKEQKLRNFHLEKFPLNSCDDNFVDRLIPIEDTPSLKNRFEESQESENRKEKWMLRKQFRDEK